MDTNPCAAAHGDDMTEHTPEHIASTLYPEQQSRPAQFSAAEVRRLMVPPTETRAVVRCPAMNAAISPALNGTKPTIATSPAMRITPALARPVSSDAIGLTVPSVASPLLIV